jgi:hypothetical protein
VKLAIHENAVGKQGRNEVTIEKNIKIEKYALT